MGAVANQQKEERQPHFQGLCSENEKPPSEFDSGEHDNTEVGEKSASFVVYFVYF